MKKPLIGLIPLVDVERDSYWMMPPYFEALEEAGALPVMLPLTADEGALAQILEMCSGLLFTGGPDADPALYGEEKLPACGLVVPRRDEMELRLFRMALAADKPVLGICRGIQLFNVALGGTLWQDLPSQAPSAIQHEQKPPYDQPAHKVSILPGTPLAALLGRAEANVTSRHHQAIKPWRPGCRRWPAPPTAWSRRFGCRTNGSSGGCSGTPSTPARPAGTAAGCLPPLWSSASERKKTPPPDP